MDWIKYHLPFYILLAAIFIQSSFPSPDYYKLDVINEDKLLHILVYGLLALLCYISLIKQKKFAILSKHAVLFTIIFCAFYGVTDEIHQYFVPYRTSEFMDWLADLIGILLVTSIIKLYLQKNYSFFREQVN